MIEELLFFSKLKFSEKSKEDLITNKISLGLLVKRSTEYLTGDIDEVVLQVVYGNMRQPPGDQNSPSVKLMTMQPEEKLEDSLTGIWAPPNRNTKAYALKLFFPNLSNAYKFLETLPTPFHIAIGYDAFKAREVMQLNERYPGQILNYGIFNNDIPSDAKLIAKTVEDFEKKSSPPNYDEKFMIQLATTNSSCVAAFVELGPSFMSTDVEAGETDCKYLFPPGYNTEEEEIQEVKKKSKKKAKVKASVTTNQEETVSVATSDLTKEQSEIDHDEILEQESDEEKESDAYKDNAEDKMFGADKATSPIDDNTENI